MYKKIINTFLSALVLSFLLLTSGTYAFAAEKSSETAAPKGVIIFVMIVIFIFTAVIAGIVSFKIKTKKIKDSEKDNSEKAKDQ